MGHHLRRRNASGCVKGTSSTPLHQPICQLDHCIQTTSQLRRPPLSITQQPDTFLAPPTYPYRPPVGVSDVPYAASVGLEGAIWVIAWMARDCRDPREANKVWPYKRVTAGALPRLPSSHLRYTIDCSLVYPYRPIPTRLCLCWLAALIHSTPRQIAN